MVDAPFELAVLDESIHQLQELAALIGGQAVLYVARKNPHTFFALPP